MPTEPDQLSPDALEAAGSIDLKKPELNVRVVRSLGQYFESRFGRDALLGIYQRTGISEDYFKDETNWVSMAYRDRLIHEMAAFSKDPRFAYKAGCFTVSKEAIGFGYAVLASFSRPRALYKKLFDLTPHFNRVGRFNVLELTDSSLTCIYQPISDEFMDDELGADFRLGQLVVWPRLCGLPDATYEQKIIEIDGRQAYHYVFRWQTLPLSLAPLWYGLLGGGLGFLDSLFRLIPRATLTEVALGVLVGVLWGRLRVMREHSTQLREAVERQVEEMSQADAVLQSKYNDLHEAYCQIEALNVDLKSSNASLKEASAEILAFNDTLKAKVDEQTQELTNRNTELREDKTKLKEANSKIEFAYKELKEFDRVKTQFFARINHELRHPLALILPPLEAILSDPEHELPTSHRQLLDTMRRNALRLLKLINSLLDLSKSAEGEMRYRYEPVSLNQLLKPLVEGIRPSTERHGLVLQTRFAEGSVPVIADAEKIEAAVLNLLSNAVKFTPSGGVIEVSTEETDTDALIRVRDNGRGIASDRIARIFDRFTDGGNEAVRGYGGTGIGLSLVKEFLAGHNGDVSVESDVGQGTTFTLRLPRGEGTIRQDVWDRRRPSGGPAVPLSRRRDESMQAAMSDYVANIQEINMSDFLRLDQESVLEPQPRVAGHPTILVIDDDLDMLYVLTSLLHDDYNLITANNAFQGEALARTHLPALILSDVMMAEKDGYSLVQDLRADEKTSQIPIILMSANNQADRRIKGIEAGAYDYVPKPFNTRELKARINAHIRHYDTLLKLQTAHRDLEGLHAQVQWMAITDRLTGLYNRRHLDTEGPLAFEQARSNESSLVCLMIDIDHFKRFNTQYGHAGGDIVLSELGRLLKEWFPGGMVARYGGEEFAVLLPDVGLSGAESRAVLFQEKVAETPIGAGRWRVTVSIGGAAYPECDVQDYEELLRLADEQLFLAKTVRNCARIARKGDRSPMMQAQPSERDEEKEPKRPAGSL